MTRPGIPGFQQAPDALVPCKVCGAAEGVPCKGKELQAGWVHFGRRVQRLLLTVKAPDREKLEDELVLLLRKHMRERKKKKSG